MSEPVFFEPRLFTFEEASALLPTLRPVLAELRTAREAVARAEQDLIERFHGGRGNGHMVPGSQWSQLDSARQDAQKRVMDAVRAISRLGCELKDPDRGMVDFRVERDGRVVYLCWLADEPRITYWHELDAGYAGRQPL